MQKFPKGRVHVLNIAIPPQPVRPMAMWREHFFHEMIVIFFGVFDADEISLKRVEWNVSLLASEPLVCPGDRGG